MKTHIIKYGDGCTLIVTLIDRNGGVIRPSVLKTLAVSLAKGATTVSNIGFTLNANGTITIALTRASHLTAVGTYNLILEGTLADDQEFSNNDQIIEVKSLQVSNPTTFTTSIILRQVHAVDETNYPLGFDGLGFEPFDANKAYRMNDVVVFNGRLYQFTTNHTAGIWNTSQVIETDIQTLLISGGVGNEIKILFIGNSNMVDSVAYAPFILKNIAPNINATIGFAYIGGSCIAQHLAYFANAVAEHKVEFTVDGHTFNYWVVPTDAKPYKRQIVGDAEVQDFSGYDFRESINGDAWTDSSRLLASDVLTAEAWDAIILQDVPFNLDWKNLRPYLVPLHRIIVGAVGSSIKLGWLMTHANPSTAANMKAQWQGIARIAQAVMGNTPTSMLIVPGTAVQNMRTDPDLAALGDYDPDDNDILPNLCVDSKHLQDGLGRLGAAYAVAAGILTAMEITSNGIVGERTRPSVNWLMTNNIPSLRLGTSGVIGISNNNCLLAQTAADNAVKYPLKVIPLSDGSSEEDRDDGYDVDEHAKTSGTYPDLVAGDILPKSDTPIEISGRFSAQTTGGDADIKSGRAYLRVIKGNLDASLNPFNADTFVSTGMNLVDSEATLTIGGKKAYYFPVVRGSWGGYGTTQESNGYIVIGGDVNEVYFKATKPTAESYGTACGKTTFNGRNYYTPSAIGWLTIICNDNTVPACHIAWSNYKDDIAGVFGNSEINISSAIAAVHSWGLAGFVTSAKVVQDVVDLESGKGYVYCDRALLKNLTWAMQTVTTTDEEEHTTTVYVFTATVSGMAENGLCAYGFEGLENNGNLLTYSSETINSVNNLKAALDEALIYYEKATPTEVSLQELGNTFNANDFGLTYFMLEEELVAVPAYVTSAFYQGGKDQLFNAVTYQKILAEVVATAFCQFEERLSAVEGRRDVSCSSLTVSRKFDMPGWRRVDAQPAAATSPGRTGDYFITSTYLYLCVDTNTWKKIAISNF